MPKIVLIVATIGEHLRLSGFNLSNLYDNPTTRLIQKLFLVQRKQ